MELINQHTKAIMEGCKERARAAGLRFTDESLEYIVTNRDLLELGPKVMIPTLYDYWVHDVEVLREKGKYELYPHNPYETVINTRPPISFYNDNNPDWLNVMIFYHVLGHIDFFQNNLNFRHTWDYDFNGEALSDKRVIAKLRAEKGHWVDYVIEFARGIDNLVDFHGELSALFTPSEGGCSPRLNYYFDQFLQVVKKLPISEYIKEVNRYNDCLKRFDAPLAEKTFFADAERRFPELESYFVRDQQVRPTTRRDLLRYLLDRSEFLNRDENKWMKSIVEIVRKTSIFFQPQIRTKILNEGWASYWHEKLFLQDDRIKGHEIDFARVHAGVTSMPRVGMNPYALGMRLFSYIEEQADKGRLSYDFERVLDRKKREDYDQKRPDGLETIFRVRENLSDHLFVSNFLDQEFLDRHSFFVAGKRLDRQRMVWQYYVKSRKAQDYSRMVRDTLYHPPVITVEPAGEGDGELHLKHTFEGKQLVREYIANTMMGIEYLWGRPVHLETTDARLVPQPSGSHEEVPQEAITWERVIYSMEGKVLTRKKIGQA
ncbi:SpoVR family protein [Geobacter sp. SVR]|uniref:SpoVR family protein n=1 Tax=Geobacter sp. SVR TaxID=2495594 RepID=UPI00143F00FA|nr:SpoVR family protein [Geobacter sp. SVR]BCS54694.1 SpoVR family protein [Geobacter sp. SVR]GCF87634.1 SpoVR family protein [Geobacter sp. SVR]